VRDKLSISFLQPGLHLGFRVPDILQLLRQRILYISLALAGPAEAVTRGEPLSLTVQPAGRGGTAQSEFSRGQETIALTVHLSCALVHSDTSPVLSSDGVAGCRAEPLPEVTPGRQQRLQVVQAD